MQNTRRQETQTAATSALPRWWRMVACVYMVAHGGVCVREAISGVIIIGDCVFFLAPFTAVGLVDLHLARLQHRPILHTQERTHIATAKVWIYRWHWANNGRQPLCRQNTPGNSQCMVHTRSLIRYERASTPSLAYTPRGRLESSCGSRT